MRSVLLTHFLVYDTILLTIGTMLYSSSLVLEILDKLVMLLLLTKKKKMASLLILWFV